MMVKHLAANRIKLSGSGALTIGSLTNDSNFITSAGAPVQSVNGGTGSVTITASGLGANTDSTATIRSGVTLGNISGTSLSSGKIKVTSAQIDLNTGGTISSNSILISADSSNGAQIIIAD